MHLQDVYEQEKCKWKEHAIWLTATFAQMDVQYQQARYMQTQPSMIISAIVTDVYT